MFLSVIIPTRNRSRMLKLCLESLYKQTLPSGKYEIWVIDNDSKDDTAEICKKYKNKINNLNCYLEKTPGLHAGRHAGLNLAKGEVLVYCDDDIVAFPTWLEGIFEAFQNPKVVLCGGKCLPKYESDPPKWLEGLWSRNKFGSWMGPLSLLNFGNEEKDIPPAFVWGCNFAIRKSTLLECGGFHPDGMPQELMRYRGDGETGIVRIMSAEGIKARYNPKASVFHTVPGSRMTVDYLKFRFWGQGISDSYSSIRHAGSAVLKNIIILRIKKIWNCLKNMRSPMKRLFYESYCQGYCFHFAEVKKDPKLLEWVLRENYIDDPDP